MINKVWKNYGIVGIRHGKLKSAASKPIFLERKSVFLTGHTGFKGSWLAALANKYASRSHRFFVGTAYTAELI